MASHRTKGTSLNLLSFSCLLSVSFFLCFPLFSCLAVTSELDPSNLAADTCSENGRIPCRQDVTEHENGSVLIRKQQEQLERLEEAVRNLNDLVSRLESQFLKSPAGSSNLPPPPSSRSEEISDSDGKDFVSDAQKSAVEESTATVTKYSTIWSEKFHFISAVKLISTPTCVTVLSLRDFEGSSKYFAVGDNLGKLYIFYRGGDLSLEFNAFLKPEESSSPTTTISSYLSVYKNETTIISGHENGVITTHRVWEESQSGDESNSLRAERIGKFELPEGDKTPIKLLTVHNIGRKKHILATNAHGKIFVFREDGSIYGSVSPNSRPVLFLRQRLMFLTETGAGFLDLRTMKVKESQCEGLNGSFVNSYVFDAIDRTKAYGATSEGELIQTILLGDAINFKCRVRTKRKLEMNEPVALQAIKGYLLISNREKVSVYNISSQRYVGAGGLRHVFSAETEEILSSFLHKTKIASDAKDEKGIKSSLPLIAGDYDREFVVAIGEDHYVAMFRSELPVFKNEFNSLLWTSPVLFFILFLFGAWHFFANKKEALTSWGPDDPFGSPGANGAGRAGEGSSGGGAKGEAAEIGGGGGSGLMRRYGSPTRYAGGGAGSYGSGRDPDSRMFDGEGRRFGAGSELKFRADKRREGLFGDGKGVGDETLMS